MSNYQCMIAKIEDVMPIPNADNIQAAKVLGETVVVSKIRQIGDVGVFFTTGTQLSEEYCHYNNLNRDKEKNADPTKGGFFEKNRNVRAQPFMKVKSEGYFAELESLSYTGVDLSTLKVGDRFEEINGFKICNKFMLSKSPSIKTGEGKKRKSVMSPYFYEHVETSQFKHNKHMLRYGDLISIQSKKHGTSMRVGYTKSLTELQGWKKWLNKVLPVFKTEEYKYTVGTRRVELSGEDKQGFHGSEEFRYEIMKKIAPALSKGMVVYGEIVGFANGKQIMPNHNTNALKDKAFTKKYGENIVYKYGCLEGQYKFHIYRVTLTTDDGTSIDFTQGQLVSWCLKNDFEPARDLVDPFFYDGNLEKLELLVEELTERKDLLTEDYEDPSHISEGVIIRIDNEKLTPTFLKNKSYAFKVMEGIESEKEVNLEDIS